MKRRHSRISQNSFYLTTILMGLGPSTSQEIHNYIKQQTDEFSEAWRDETPNNKGTPRGLTRLRTALSASVKRGELHLDNSNGRTGVLYSAAGTPSYWASEPIIEQKENPTRHTITMPPISADQKINDSPVEIKEINSIEEYNFHKEKVREYRSNVLCRNWQNGRCYDHEKGQCDFKHPKKTDLDAYTEGVYTEVMERVGVNLLHALTTKAKRDGPSMDVIEQLLALIEMYRGGDMTGKDFDKAVGMIRRSVNE